MAIRFVLLKVEIALVKLQLFLKVKQFLIRMTYNTNKFTLISVVIYKVFTSKDPLDVEILETTIIRKDRQEAIMSTDGY